MSAETRRRFDSSLSPGARFTRAMDTFAGLLDAPRRGFSGLDLENAFLDIEFALFFMGDVTNDAKSDLTLGLAHRGEAVATERGYPGTAAIMRMFQERIIDAKAIRHGEYEFVRMKRDHGEQHGAPETQTPIYRRPDGVEVRGPTTSLREGMGRSGHIITLAPHETTTSLDPRRRLPPTLPPSSQTVRTRRGV